MTVVLNLSINLNYYFKCFAIYYLNLLIIEIFILRLGLFFIYYIIVLVAFVIIIIFSNLNTSIFSRQFA
jgi:hypothetical protein